MPEGKANCFSVPDDVPETHTLENGRKALPFLNILAIIMHHHILEIETPPWTLENIVYIWFS
jgi:hypothetical protein